MPKNKKPSKGQVTTQQIIDAACALFIEKGYHATSMRDIADKTNLTVSAFYNHFSNKEDTFPAVLEKYHPWIVIPPTIAKVEGNNLEEIVRDATNRIIPQWKENPDYVRLHLIELVEFHGKHLPDLFDQIFNEMITAIDQLIFNNPKLEGINTDALARSLLGLFFTYLMSDTFTCADFVNQKGAIGFDYLTDIYLQGALQQNNLNSEGESKA